MISLGFGVDPTRPFAFEGMVVADAGSIAMTLQALSVAERTPVGAPFSAGPVPIERGGAYLLDFGRVTIAGEADPIVQGAQVEADLVLVGEARADGLLCGTIRGMMYRPAEIPLDGTFGAVAVDDYDGVDLVSHSRCPF